MYKTSIGVPESTSTERYSVSIHNTLYEIAEAQRIAQLERFSMTRPGRRILAKLGIQYHEQQGAKTPVPDEIRTKIRVDAIPRNVHPDTTLEDSRGERRRRRTCAPVTRAPATWMLYANRRGFAVAVVNAGGNIRAAASTTSSTPEEAEEVAIALAIKDPGCSTVLSDSKQAIKNFARGRVSPAATRIPKEIIRLYWKGRESWFPAHAGEVSDANVNHNETAHACAREL